MIGGAAIDPKQVLGPKQVLVFDGDDKVRRGMVQLLGSEGLGLSVTAVAELSFARDLSQERTFAVALIDLDSPERLSGLELVRLVRQHSPLTAVFVLSAQKTFEGAVLAMRAGANDLIIKTPDQLEYLKHRVSEVCAVPGDQPAFGGDPVVLSEILAVQEEFLHRLMDVSRHLAERESEEPTAGDLLLDPSARVLIVEPDGWLQAQLTNSLEGELLIRGAASGGHGLDLASSGKFQIAFVCDRLPDLPGRTVVSALKSQSPDTIILIFSRPIDAQHPGRIDVIEGSREIPLIPEFHDPRQLAERFEELLEAFHKKSRERRYLVAFRKQNYDLLRRYAEIKQKLSTRT